MKAEDLMIGDWVKIKTYGVSDKYERTEAYIYVKVAEIGSGLITVQYNNDIKEPYRIRENIEIEPIPLTSEILEKNGFKCTEVYEKYEWNEHHIEIWIIMRDSNDGEKLDVIHIDNWQNSIPISYHNTIQYVHQLQHALRLCGIDKEIIL